MPWVVKTGWDGCARGSTRSETAKGVSAGNEKKKEGEPIERTVLKVRKKEYVWPRQIQNVETENDVIEVVSVSSDSDVFFFSSCA